MISRLLVVAAAAWSLVTCGAQKAPKKGRQHVPALKVLVSVITRNRFWPHALSMISLLESVRHATLPGSSGSLQVVFELHVIDDASDSNVNLKRRLLQDLVDRGHVQNYTQLPRRIGTVGALRHVVDVLLTRPDIDYWFHCDDDVLMGPATLQRAVHDYHSDLTSGRWRQAGREVSRGAASPQPKGGGLLAVFVNSWLDEQLSMAAPAFGDYAVAPFLGGASYLADRATLETTGNPWARALEANPKASPHDAHVFWLAKLLPERSLPIWVRWKQPYQCQHLANVRTLNFGRQPTWEPMWAIDHRTKRLIEVDGYESVSVRAALWAGGEVLSDFVSDCNARASVQVKLPPGRSTERTSAWSDWDYPKLHVHYIEIGTADFDALVQRHVWREEITGFSIEPVKAYFERLPANGGENKTLLNVAISDHDGYEDVFFVRPELVEGYMGSESLCQTEALLQAGLKECLPGWTRGASSIKRWPAGVRQLLGDEQLPLVLATAHVPSLTYETLMRVYGIGSVDIVKIDAEGFDHVILRQIIDFAARRKAWPWQIQFEKNMLSDWQALDAEVQRLQDAFHYKCHMTGVESAACWRPDAMT